MENSSFVLAVRQAVGETQEKFAARVGIGVRSLKRYEISGTEPKTLAARRQIETLAKRHGIKRDGVSP